MLPARALNPPPEVQPHDRLWWVGVAAALSFALHVALYVFLAHPHPRPVETATRVSMEIVEPPSPPPAPVQHAKPVEAPKPVKLPTPKVPPPPPSNQPPPAKAAPPPPVHIGLSLSSTVGSGTIAVPVGNTLAGKPTNAVDPNSVRALPENAFVPNYAVSEAPEVDQQPDMQAYYPPPAREQNLEGQVLLQLDIDATGRVTNAKVRRGAGNGFDEAAVRAALEKLHFKPARFQGKTVATQIQYKFTFLLD